MSRSLLRLERLTAHHDVASFASGNAERDGWLRRHALTAQQMDSARTFVLSGEDRIVGYFSLTMEVGPTGRRSRQARARLARLPGGDGPRRSPRRAPK